MPLRILLCAHEYKFGVDKCELNLDTAPVQALHRWGKQLLTSKFSTCIGRTTGLLEGDNGAGPEITPS